MLFNSIDFAIFLPIVFILYWFVTNKNLKLQNFLVACASYVFYGWWDWRFLILILLSTLIDYSAGLLFLRTREIKKRKILLWITVGVNLGLLFFFKYYNFFAESFAGAFSFFGTEINAQTLNIILPVGISFYTFQNLSYSIDVYRGNIRPTKDFIAFAAFISFFPQLVAGPIERAAHLLPQFKVKRHFDYHHAVDGLRQILWGLFKKIVIADNCAQFANAIFDNPDAYPGSTLLLGALFFTFQIYGDFSGYSDIAIGTARLFGFNLMRNFAYPYFSRDIAEFWRRWHISLSTWFRDFVYIPLGGSKGSMAMKVRNIFIVFILSGLWHGANWTFIVWGTLNAIYFLPLLLTGHNKDHTDTVAEYSSLPTLKEFMGMALTFGLTVIAWIFFRAEDLTHAWHYLSKVFSSSLLSKPVLPQPVTALITVLLIVVFILIEWRGRRQQYAIADIGLKWKRPLRWSLYYVIVMVIFLFAGKQQQFIYFQF